MGESEWLNVPFVPPAVKPPPNPIPLSAEKARTTCWLSAPHFFLDKLSEYPLENSGRYWDEVSRYGCDFYTDLSRSGKTIENLEKFCILAENDIPAALLPIFVDHPRINENQRKDQYVEMQ